MKLTANNPTEKRLLEYLDANASVPLLEKIEALPEGPRFNLGAAWTFIHEEARKHLHARSGYVEDATVFGWLVHYYEDVAPAEAAKPEKKPAEKPSGFEFEFFGEKGGAE